MSDSELDEEFYQKYGDVVYVEPDINLWERMKQMFGYILYGDVTLSKGFLNVPNKNKDEVKEVQDNNDKEMEVTHQGRSEEVREISGPTVPEEEEEEEQQPGPVGVEPVTKSL